MIKKSSAVPGLPKVLAMAICSALTTMSLPVKADPLLGVKLFRDSEVMFRDADMSRWTDNYVELGLGYNSKDSLRFGQFSGLTDKGGFPLLGFNWQSRDHGNDAQYWRIHGGNLGLDSRKIEAEGGVQGVWNLSLSLNQLKKSQTESAVFLHDGLGTKNLTLPGGVTFNDADNVTPGLLRPFEIKHGRDVYQMGLAGNLANGWDVNLSFREDRRDGTRLTGLPQRFGNQPGATTGSGIAMIVPYPVEDRTRQIEATVGYASKVAQLQFGYTYSNYDNPVKGFNVQNPFNFVAATIPNLRLSMAPSNDYHQVRVTGAYNISKTTRLTGKYSHGVARQNETFLPYSANGAASTTALPRGSLDAKVVTTLLDVALTAKPMDKMNLKLGYQYRDSDNRTPVDTYRYASRDDAALVGATSARTNAPVSTSENRVTVEADYQIADRTTLRAGLERSNKRHTLTDRERTTTDKLSLDVRKPVSDEFVGNVGFAHTRRTGSEYDKNRFYRETYRLAYAAAVAGTTAALDNIPSMRSTMYNDYNENRVHASGNWTVSETISVQGGINKSRRNSDGPDCSRILDPKIVMPTMPDTCLGQKSADTTGLNLDLQWQPAENLTSFAFGNFSETKFDQLGRSWNTAGGTALAEAVNPARNYSVVSTYRDTTLGLGLKWQPEEKWDLGGTYVYQVGRGLTNVSVANPALFTGGNAISPMPDLTNRLHSLQMFAKYDYSKQLTWRLNYVYENLRSTDWSYDGLGPTVNPSVLLTGQSAPRYSNHVFGVSAVVKSW